MNFHELDRAIKCENEKDKVTKENHNEMDQ